MEGWKFQLGTYIILVIIFSVISSKMNCSYFTCSSCCHTILFIIIWFINIQFLLSSICVWTLNIRTLISNVDVCNLLLVSRVWIPDRFELSSDRSSINHSIINLSGTHNYDVESVIDSCWGFIFWHMFGFAFPDKLEAELGGQRL